MPTCTLKWMTLLCLSLLLPDAIAYAPRPHASHVLIRVLILDGESVEEYHSWELTTKVLKRELEDTGRFSVTVSTAPHYGTNFGDFDPHFGQYQVVIWNYDAPDWPKPLQTELEDYLRGGGGMVVVHAADNAFPNWQEFNRMIGMGGWRGRDEKAGPMWHYDHNQRFVSEDTPGKAGKHGVRLPFRLDTRSPQNPIMRGIPATWMHAPDELYGTLRGPGSDMTVLASAHSDPANEGTGFDEPLIVTIRYGKGRIFHTMLGHDGLAMSCVGFSTTFQRGTEWAATGRVTQAVPSTFPTASTVSYRVEFAMLDPAFARGARTVANRPAASTRADPGAKPAPSPAAPK